MELISVSEVGSLNAPVRFAQPKKAPCSIVATEFPKTSSEKLLPSNAKTPIWLTELGIIKVPENLHPLKVVFSIVEIEEGRVRLPVRRLHSQNALSPILVTEFGMVSEPETLQ